MTALYRLHTRITESVHRIPDSLISLLCRIALGVTFWQSGQSKIEGFMVNLVSGDIQLGWPKISSSAYYLFEHEYHLPILPFQIATVMAVWLEHLGGFALLIGFATRYISFLLLGMTLVIEIFVYPDAYAVHALWAAGFIWLIRTGAGVLSVDEFLRRRVIAS